MGGELVVAEKTWLEVVKAAANVEEHYLSTEEHGVFPNTINPTWLRHLNEPKDKTDVQSGSLEILSPLPIENEEALNSSQTSSGLKKEQVLVKLLKQNLVQSNGLSKQSFVGALRPYLLSLRGRQDESSTAKVKSPGRRKNGVVDGNDEESILSLLKNSARLLGQRVVALVLECCICTNYWAPVQVLLERRVVVSNSSSQLVRSLVEQEQALILCLYITNVPDLAPQDVYSMLTFFLDSTVSPSKLFQLVRRDWRRVAEIEIEKAGRDRDALRAAPGMTKFQGVDKLHRGRDSLVSSAIGLAMAVDGFSSPELCIHYLLASGQDEGVLSSVVAQLSPAQILKLTKYLGRWMERYSSYLENFPVPKNGRIPSLPQVLSWAGVILEGHFTQLVLSVDFHDELKSMRSLVQSLVAFGIKICPLGGITSHIKSQSLLPAQKFQGGAASDYVIELLDMS